MRWLEAICQANERFKANIESGALPIERQSCPYAIITCMDPRINLEAVGIRPFASNGKLNSHVRIIRTVGGMGEHRSLVVGLHLAGIKEIAVMMHTDCGCSLAFHKIDNIIENMKASLGSKKFEDVKEIIGTSFRENLVGWLHAFEDPREAVKKEVVTIKASSFVPETLVVHGLVYDLSSGSIEVVVNGYDMRSSQK